MDLNNERHRKMLFAGIVAFLVVLGLWLVWPRPDTTPRPQPSSAAALPTSGPSTAPPGINTTVAPESFDIYRLLPHGQKDFATAAGVAQQFISLYGTYRHDEDVQVYLSRLRPLVIDAVFEELRAGESSAGVIEDRKANKTVAEGTASLNKIRSIGDSSIIFEVTGLQQVTKNGVKDQASKRWAVTVMNDGGAWRVFSFAPAELGDDGEAS